MNLDNKLNCIVLTSKPTEYKKIDDVPKSEYKLIHTVKDLHPDFFTEGSLLFKKIKNWTNLRYISFDIKNWNNRKISNKIAIFQKLSMVLLIDYQYTDFKSITCGNYFYKNKMIMFNPTIEELSKIPDNIEYLNIVSSLNHEYSNLPFGVKHLHLTVKNTKNYKQTNLPISLETLTITIPDLYSAFIVVTDIKSSTKLPYGCELIFDIM